MKESVSKGHILYDSIYSEKDKNIEKGLLLSTDFYDKNLSIKNLVDDLFMKNKVFIKII